MSDYISKEETINTIWKTFDSFADNPSNFELEETYAIRRFCFKLQEEMKAQPTLDEKEIIRKPFERVVERLEERKDHIMKEFVLTDKAKEVKSDSLNRINELDGTIEIVKEECGISE